MIGKKNVLILVAVALAVLAVAMFLVLGNNGRVSEFEGPVGQPRVQGPSGPPPGM